MKIVKVNYNGKITKRKLFCRCDHRYPSTDVKTYRGYVKFNTGPEIRCPYCSYYMWFYTRENLHCKFNHDFLIIEEVPV